MDRVIKTCAVVALIFTVKVETQEQRNNTTCTLGRTADLRETTANPNPGLYIDIDYPAPCSGAILQWTVCYYDPTPYHFERVVEIGLQVWRFDSELRNGFLVGEVVLSVNIPDQPDTFQCLTIDQPADTPLNVTKGDMLGVVHKFNSVLPVVGNFPAHRRLLFFPSSLLDNKELVTESRGTVLGNNAVHVTAGIGPVTASDTRNEMDDPFVTPGAPTSTEATTSPDHDDSSNSTAGVVVGVLCVITFVAVASTVIVTTILIVKRVRAKTSAKLQDEDANYAVPYDTQCSHEYLNSVTSSTERLQQQNVTTNVAYNTAQSPYFAMDSNVAYRSSEEYYNIFQEQGDHPYSNV